MTNDRDWRQAGEECLVTLLDRMRAMATDCGDIKQLDSAIKTVGEIVGTGTVLGGAGGEGGDGKGDDDDDA